MIRTSAQHRRGNALVELVLLVPLYVLIIAGALLLGEIALVQMQSHEANEYAALEPGDQSESAGLRESGPMKATFWDRYLGSLDLAEISEGPSPSTGEIEELLEEMTTLQYSTSAYGSFSFVDGRLQYTVTTSQHSWRRWEGNYVLSHGLLEDGTPQLIHDTLADYMDRNRVQTVYNFAPDYLTWSKFELEGAAIPTGYQTARRGGLVREVDRSFGAPNAPIERLTPRFGDGSGVMEDFPNFMSSDSFWDPN